MKENKIISNVMNIIMAGVLIIFVFIMIDANINHYTAKIEADIASETLLATVIYENGFTQPDTWYASSAFRVISSPDLAAIIYPVIGYNANLAMGISCSIMMIIMLVVMFIYLRQIGFSPFEILVACTTMFAITNPADETQRMIFLYASYYVSHVITLLLILIMYDRYIKRGKLSWIAVAASFLIAVLNGMQGLHACLFCYIPLILTEAIRFRRSNKSIRIWVVLMTIVSYGTNRIVGAYDPGSSRNIRHSLEKFIDEVWPTICETISFGRIPALAVIIVAAAIIGYVLYLMKIVKSEEGLSASVLVFVFGFLICVFLTTFTTSLVAGRYYLMLIFIIAIGLAMFIKHFGYNTAILCTVLISVYSVFAIIDFYDVLISGDNSKNSDAYKVTEWMQENGYEYGYATFDNANMMTVLSNNQVKIRAVNNLADMEGCKWLTDTTWYPPVKSTEGETCYIVNEYTNEDFNKFLEDYDADILNVENLGYYTVYVLDHDYTVWER